MSLKQNTTRLIPRHKYRWRYSHAALGLRFFMFLKQNTINFLGTNMMGLLPCCSETEIFACLKRMFSGNCLSKRHAGRVLAKSLSLTTDWVGILARTCEKVASHLLVIQISSTNYYWLVTIYPNDGRKNDNHQNTKSNSQEF